MLYDSRRIGLQGVQDEDREYRGSRYREIRDELFRSAYYLRWGEKGAPPLPTYGVTLGRVLRGLLRPFEPWHFLAAARRTLESPADMRRGPDGRGYRRLLHPNGVCLFGTWRIDQRSSYSGYFATGSEALVVARYSTCCTETRGNRYRSLSLVGKLFPTTDPDHAEPLRTANFITQEDLGGSLTSSFAEAELVNAPDTTPWRRKWALPVLLVTGVAFMLVDIEPAVRQLYPIAELGLPAGAAIRTPPFMRLRALDAAGKPVERPTRKGFPWNAWFEFSDRDAGPDFRDEILARFYEPNAEQPRANAKLEFSIEVTDASDLQGVLRQRRSFPNGWHRLGTLTFTDAVASYAGDHVIHFAHPPWRRDVDDPDTVVRS
ncbi:MAG: hypothetical protein U0939_23880 [Pirellulales bacterium]